MSNVALREGRHIGVTLFVNRLPPRAAAGVLQDIYPAEPGTRRKISEATLDG